MSKQQGQKLQELPDRLNFAKAEEETLAFWKEIDAFQTSLKKSEGKPAYNFYDGPPFATGLPHYGHLLAGTIKDVVCRFAHQTGHHVERRFGWDCHGLPIEVEIEKQEGISGSKAVAEMGLANYNKKCRDIVMRFSKEWETTVTRAGRWIDFQKDYKTMNQSYMESVWWVFSELFKKGLVYRGFKVMPYSTGCTTPLSNFECNMNYKDVSDPSLVITFPLEEDPNTQLLAWTTTPWTLPSNLATVVHPTMEYVKVLDKATSRNYILAEARISEVYKKEEDYQVLEKFPGEALRGKKYVPLFKYFEKYGDGKNGNAFRVLVDSYVTSDSGTGVVHSAPGFGEDDYRVCKEANVLPEGVIVCPVDENGCYYPEVADYAGRYVKDCDNDIAARLKKEGRLISKGAIVHSYPFCWRSETPLIYKAVEAWFIRVEAIKDKLVANNKTTTWVPEFVQTKRFSNWLEDARDWNVSRNRYWGTPLPLWVSDDLEEVVCVGSVEELQKLTGRTDITDLHREFVDEMTIPSKREGKPPLKRVPQVFDCWFESGSMPYAQKHYPFENKEQFEANFPADFIAEGLDQTRGWFYTLMVLGTALFDKAPFKNLVVNGLVLAEDGQKMSKSKKNYPDPVKVIDEYGADALRLYLINSPVVRAEPLKFREKGVKEVVNDVFMPLMNTAKFFLSQCNRFLEAGGKIDLSARSTNDTDRWIEAAAQTLVAYVKKEMAAYKLYNVVPGVLKFVDTLSGWYVRMNRRRIKGAGDLEDWSAAMNTLFHVLYTAIRVLAPFAPFFTEYIYQRLRPLLGEDAEESLHYLMIPDVDSSRFDQVVEDGMNHLIDCVELVRVLRDREKCPLKLPVKEVIVIHPDPAYVEGVKALGHYIQSEVNCLELKFSSDEGEYVTSKIEPNMAALGQRFKGDTDKKAAKGVKVKELSKEEKAEKDAARKKQKEEQTALINAVKNLTKEEQQKFKHDGGMTLCGHALTMDDIKIVRNFKEGIQNYATNTGGEALVLMDTRKDEGQIDAWRAREFVSRIQMLRKDAKLQISDEIKVWYTSSDKEVLASIERAAEVVNETIKMPWAPLKDLPADATPFAAVNEEDDAEKAKKFPITIKFTKA